MTSTSLPLTADASRRANKFLQLTLRVWFIVAVIGQLFFAAYVGAFYGGAAINGNLAAWNEVLTPGYQEGETLSNFVIGIHLFFAFLITLAGPLQFILRIRQSFPTFHRWNGRMYVTLTAIGGISGFYMIWAHDDSSTVSHLAMSIEAFLIVLAGVLVWRKAVQRKMKQHEQWAVRLFLVASGVWFFRVFLMGWIIVNGRAVGFDPETFEGPFLTFLSYAHYLIPLAVYELYLLAQRSKGTNGRYAMGGLMIICIAVTVIGIFGATVGMWLPAVQ